MVELPPTLRAFLSFDFTFASFGKRLARAAALRHQPEGPAPPPDQRAQAGRGEDRPRLDRLAHPDQARPAAEPPRPAVERALPRRGAPRRRAAHPRHRPRGHARPRLPALHGVRPLPRRAGRAGRPAASPLRLDDLESHVALNPELALAATTTTTATPTTEPARTSARVRRPTARSARSSGSSSGGAALAERGAIARRAPTVQRWIERRAGPASMARACPRGQLAASRRPRSRCDPSRRRGRRARCPTPTSRLDVVFEDEHLLVIDKPAGLVVHPPRATRRARWCTACRAPAASTPGSVGRRASLRRPARASCTGSTRAPAGLLVVAKDASDARGAEGRCSRRTTSSASTWRVVVGRRQRRTIDAAARASPARPDALHVPRGAGRRQARRHARAGASRSSAGRRWSRAGWRRAARTRSACTSPERDGDAGPRRPALRQAGPQDPLLRRDRRSSSGGRRCTRACSASSPGHRRSAGVRERAAGRHAARDRTPARLTHRARDAAARYQTFDLMWPLDLTRMSTSARS